MTLCVGVHAEMSGEDYVSEAVIRSEAERTELRERIEAARLREDAAAAERARVQAAALAERLAREEAARSPGERLLHQYCLGCHAESQLITERRTRFGWWLTVLRMRAWNGADVPVASMPAIVRYLVRMQGAGTTRAAAEMAVLAGGLVLGLWVFRRRWHRRA